jgi:hypothetical protein
MEGDGAFSNPLEESLSPVAEEPPRLPEVVIEDNAFSVLVSHRGADEAQTAAAREAVSALLAEEFPMLRSVEERMEIEVRPEAAWNRTRALEWLVAQLVDSVKDGTGARGLKLIYCGEDGTFSHVAARDGIELLVGAAACASQPDFVRAQTFYLQSPLQVDELFKWFAEVRGTVGVTVGAAPRAASRSALKGAAGAAGAGGLTALSKGAIATAERAKGAATYAQAASGSSQGPSPPSPRSGEVGAELGLSSKHVSLASPSASAAVASAPSANPPSPRLAPNLAPPAGELLGILESQQQAARGGGRARSSSMPERSSNTSS